MNKLIILFSLFYLVFIVSTIFILKKDKIKIIIQNESINV
jgi:hypothetical protein